MQTNVQEFYAQNILPMSEFERLKIASLILNDLVKEAEARDNQQNQTPDLDNKRIDADKTDE
ncbi:MAG: hypothetical protein H0V31_10150 [Acidobacteria bacterium]|nr:hypothetical protein [Acidobacteriota bacterium]